MERDYGSLNDLVSTGPSNVIQKHGQVFQATHEGENYLPFMYRSFISFTYGERHIEDFDLIATISGNRLNRKGYAQFNDTVSTYDNLDGQHYWATHYKTNQIDFTLSTDGMDQKQLDDFLHWFKAGTSRELVLAEHPNRAIMARVAKPPELNLLPFEHEVTVKVSNLSYQTKTTLYKGDIQLSFIMDQPHWYAKLNILGKAITRIDPYTGNEIISYQDHWDDANGQDVEVISSPDALKILYEDGIPLGSMIGSNMLLGNGTYANVESQIEGQTWSKNEDDEDFWSGQGARIDGIIAEATEYDAGRYIGIIAGASVNAGDRGIYSLSKNVKAYFFYAGTAPSPTKFEFDMQIQINGDGYVCSPCNSYASYGTDAVYNTITIGSINEQILRFTTPNLFTSYNKAISIFKTMVDSSNSWERIREAIRDEVRHAKVRAWAIKQIDTLSESNETITNGNASTLQSTLINNMKHFLLDDSQNNPKPQKAHFSFNAETGEALGTFYYRNIDGDNFTMQPVEDVGDMLKSNYIIIQDRNYPTSDGRIIAWINTNDVTRQYSHYIQHDVEDGLENLQILYKNMYL